MAKKVTRIKPMTEPIRQFTKLFEQLRYNHNAFSVFSDFLALSAISISNAVNFNEDREQEHLRIVKNYTKNEIELFPQMLNCIVDEMQPAKGTIPRYYDVLGELFGGLELTDSWKGQFFTPQNVSDMMALMTAGEYEEVLKEKGYIRMLEPCIGGGANIIGAVNAMFQRGYNPCKQLLVTGYDLDARCIHMSYIQLSLMGVPAILQQRNSLTDKVFGDYWFTPVFVIDRWCDSLRLESIVEVVKEFLTETPAESETPTPVKPVQLSLF